MALLLLNNKLLRIIIIIYKKINSINYENSETIIHTNPGWITINSRV